jgi:CheY-like chemotaxis protein
MVEFSMGSPVTDFGGTAKSLAHNPLGIIALFIVLIYGVAGLVTGLSSSFSAAERIPLIYFLVGFPVLVLGVFTWLVTRHPGHLFAPGDFKNEENYIKGLTASASLTAAKARSAELTSAAVGDVVSAVKVASGATGNTGGASWRRQVLWVDDRPENNVYERDAFEAFGLSFTLARSTDEALRELKHQRFAAIISDMGRKEGPEEGYVLLDDIRAAGDSTPYFIYTGSNTPKHRLEISEHGGQVATNQPDELFQAVLTAVLSR